MNSSSLPIFKTLDSLFRQKYLRSPKQEHYQHNIRSFSIKAAAITKKKTKSEHDVVIVGGGIIGLSIARHLLLNSNLSVAVVDASVPCSGATGAGQGYIWMVHLTPGSDSWELSTRSKQLWEELASSVESQGLDPLHELGWKRTGSLLIGRSSEELAVLEKRTELLSNAGLRAEYLSSNNLHSKEPALELKGECGAVFSPDDCQLDAFRTVAFLEKVNHQFSSEGRYAEFYDNPAIDLIRSKKNGLVEGIQTAENILYSKQSVVVAAGAWSGSLMDNIVIDSDLVPSIPVKPRKGHLLILENFDKMHINHGLMEVGYIGHKTAKSSSSDNQDLSSISMTATTDMNGNLLLGSSRQFVGFSREVDESIVERIWKCCAEFFPAIRNSSPEPSRIRIGHRPYMPDGKPVIGPVPGLRNVFLAAGHEGNGLSMALGTAELVCDMILDNPLKVDCAPFSMQGRFVN